MTDEFADLNALLNEQLQKSKDSAKVVQHRSKLARMKEGDPERDRVLAAIRAYEDKHEWDTAHNVALTKTRVCLTCNSVERWFEGMYRKQVHRRYAATTRMVQGAAPGYSTRLEEKKEQPTKVCSICVAAQLPTLDEQEGAA